MKFGNKEMEKRIEDRLRYGDDRLREEFVYFGADMYHHGWTGGI